jgi:hypothetical protein
MAFARLQVDVPPANPMQHYTRSVKLDSHS